MRIAIGCDHRGFKVKTKLIELVTKLGHQVTDAGAFSAESCDYPDMAADVGRMVGAGKVERGILICGSGVGVCVAANKMPGIRACMCHDHYSAHQGVEHDNMNVLVLGSRVIGGELAKDLVRDFLRATFSGEERHVRRLQKVKAIEGRYLRPGG